MTPTVPQQILIKTSFVKPLVLAIACAMSSVAMATSTFDATTSLGSDQTTDILLNTSADPLLTLDTAGHSITPTTNSAITVASSKQVMIRVRYGSVLSASPGYSAIQVQPSATDAVSINNAGTLLGNGGGPVILGAPTASGLLSITNLSGGVIGRSSDYNNTTIASGSRLWFTQNYGSTFTGGIVGSNGTQDQVYLNAGDFSGHEISQVETVFIGQSAGAGEQLKISRKVTVDNGVNKGNVHLMAGELFLVGASGTPATESFVDNGRIHITNGNFHSFGTSSIVFELSPNDSAESRIKVSGAGNSVNLNTNTKLKLIPTNGTFSSGILNKDIVLFEVRDGATVNGWLGDENSAQFSSNFEISPLLTSQSTLQKAVNGNGVAIRFSAGGSGGGSSQLQNLASSGGANSADVKALGVAGDLANVVIAKNGNNVSQQEADFAAVIVKATNAESAKRLAQELQAQGNTANIVAARTAQQSAIKNATGRIQAIRLANSKTNLSELAFAAAESSASTMTDAAVGTPLYAQQGIWVEGVNVSAKQSDSSAQLGYDADANGLSIGYDRQLTDQLLLGAAFTYGKTSADVNSSRDNSDIDTYQLSLYGSYEGETPDGREWLTDAVLNVGHNEHENERYLDGFSNQAHKASFDSQQAGLRVVSSVGYEHNGWSIAPSLGFNYAKVELDGYTETSGPAALKVSGQSIEQVELGAGISTRRSFDVTAGTLEPYLGVMAWHDFNNDALSSTSRFVLGGNSFTSADADTSANRFQVNLGASLQVNDQTNLGFGYEHTKSGSLKSNQWNLALRYEF